MVESTENSEWSLFESRDSSWSTSEQSSTFCTANSVEEFESVLSFDDSSSESHESIELEKEARTTLSRVRDFVHQFVPPIVRWIPKYTLRKFEFDVIASVSVVTALIPQAVAFAQLANLDVRFAFQSAGVAPIIYSLLGTSHVTGVGPIALLAALSADAVGRLPLSTATPQIYQDEFERASIALACLTGVILLAFGVLRLGVIVRFMAEPVTAGFLTATGVIIAVGQLQHLFGVKIASPQKTVFHTLYAVLSVLDTTNIGALVVSICSIAFLLLARWIKAHLHHHRLLRLFPDQLLLIVVSTAVSYGVGLEQTFQTDVIGPLTPSFPILTLPDATHMGALFVDALLIALVGFAQTITLSQKYAHDSAFPVQPSQEFVALGTAEIVAAFFSAFVVTGGLTRTALAAAAGAATPLHGLFVGILALLFGFIANLLHHLPRATLSSTILLSSAGLISTKINWSIDKSYVLLMASTIVITLMFGVQNGLIASVGISITLVVVQSSRAHSARLGLVQNTRDTFLNVRRFRKAKEVMGTLIFHYDAQLFFANAQHFADTLHDEVRLARREGNSVRSVVIDFAAIGSIDTTAMDMLLETAARFERHKIRIMFAQVNGPVRDMFGRFNVDCDDPARFQPTLRSAIIRLSAHGFAAQVHLESRRPSMMFSSTPSSNNQ
jgi:SulP family sulfate permease